MSSRSPISTEFFVSGTIRTQSSAGLAEVVHVRDGVIAGVGSTAFGDTLRDAGVMEIEASGAVIPAFIDPHTHLTPYAISVGRGVDCRVPTCRTIDEVAHALAARAEATPEGEWVIGYGNLFFDQKLAERRLPTRAELDAVSTTHPIVLHCGGHVSILNSRALELARVERYLQAGSGLFGSPVVGLDDDGAPSGYVAEIDGHLPIPDPEPHTVRTWIEETFRREWLSNGVVTIGEMLGSESHLQPLTDVFGSDSAPGRAALYAMTPMFRSPDEVFEWVTSFPSVQGQFWAQGVKLFADGGYSARNAASVQPYSPDHSPRRNYRGRLNQSREHLNSLFAGAVKHNIQLAIHANGTRAQREVLMALELATVKPRTRVEHLGNLLEDPADIDAWKSTGVTPVLQPGFLTNFIGDYIPMLFPGAGVTGRMSLRSIIDAAVRPVFSSDVITGADIGAANPWKNIQAAVERRSFWGLQIEPHESISVEEAIQAYTIDAARAVDASHLIGSLEAGKQADLVVLDHDPVHVAPSALGSTQTELVIKAGRLVHGDKQRPHQRNA